MDWPYALTCQCGSVYRALQSHSPRLFSSARLLRATGVFCLCIQDFERAFPLHAWSRSTFIKIGSRWGEVLELEENKDECFARKRICIKTKKEDNILEKFKIIVRGKGDVINIYVASKQVQPDVESDVEGVSDTCFGDQDNESGLNHLQPQSPNAKEKSSDPFNLYDLLDKHKLNKQDKGKVNSTSDSSIPYPPGFTSENAHNFSDPQKVNDVECHMSQNRSNGFSSRIMEDLSA
ncbi:hypothetical protein Tco_1533937 [Tanacetum coccineum]